jgi:carbon storage regulator
MLILSRKKDDCVMIGDQIELWVVDIRGDTVRLGIKAPKDVKVYRHEVFVEIQKANRAAAIKNVPELPELNTEPE